MPFQSPWKYMKMQIEITYAGRIWLKQILFPEAMLVWGGVGSDSFKCEDCNDFAPKGKEKGKTYR